MKSRGEEIADREKEFIYPIAEAWFFKISYKNED
jgi:hypothetical protein